MSTIDLSKKYRTRNGQKVRLYAPDGEEPYPIHGARLTPQGWVMECWKKLGKYQSENGEHEHDLVEVSPYDHIKIDDPVYVWDSDYHDKYKAHFAGISVQGKPLTYVNGKTSWTSQGQPLLERENCELAFPDK